MIALVAVVLVVWVAVVATVWVVTHALARRRREKRKRNLEATLGSPIAVVTFRAKLSRKEHQAIIARLQLQRGQPVVRA